MFLRASSFEGLNFNVKIEFKIINNPNMTEAVYSGYQASYEPKSKHLSVKKNIKKKQKTKFDLKFSPAKLEIHW